MAAKACAPCPSNSVKSQTDPYSCIPCADPKMTVSTSGICTCPSDYTIWNNECLLTAVYATIVGQYPIEIAATVNYKQVYETMAQKIKVTPSSQNVRSNIIYQQFYPAATQCKQMADVAACNNLANMCVAQLYEEQTSACQLFSSIINAKSDNVNGFPGWRAGMPWLKYSALSNSIISNDDIAMKVALTSKNKSGVKRLTYILSVYKWSGEWLGFRELTNELSLCPGGNFDQTRFLNFGAEQKIECRFNVRSLIKFDEPEFYELYILDGKNLYPVPVQIFTRDVKRMKPKDRLPQHYQLYRRFFLYDNIVGKKSVSDLPDVVRIAESVTLTVSLRRRTQEKINPPVLSIRYTSRKLGTFNSESSNFTTADSVSIYTPTVCTCSLCFLAVSANNFLQSSFTDSPQDYIFSRVFKRSKTIMDLCHLIHIVLVRNCHHG